MKQFDFSHTSFKKHHPEVQAFLKRRYKTGISEGTFVKEYQGLSRPLNSKGKIKSKKGRRNPSRLRGQYRRLKKRFNFF